ncbi:cobalt ECF transporter T component CbiQ [Dietzia kunjamensis]|uniref:cobalt ECF transporter T component CbiQ n=1 Tax=Dietzia kunjamensis TaxID=322509 RepID=UPI0039BD1C57
MSAGTAAIDSVAWRSTWRRRPVAEKVILFGGIVGCAMVLAPVPAAPLLIVVTLIAARRAGVPFAHVLRTARGPAAFIAIAALSTAVSIDFGALTISMNAHTALGAAELALRAMTASLAMLVFASTTPMTTLTTALRRAGLPAACVDVIGIMYRMVFVLVESLATIRQAQVARLGYAGFRRSLNSVGLLTAAVLIRSWTQAHRLETGLAGRDQGIGMPVLYRQPVSRQFIFGSVSVLIGVVALTLSWEMA